jgi:hypoxanthine phosphoribosyltransferase
MISHYWNIPLIPLQLSTIDHQTNNISMFNEQLKQFNDHKLLIVDDIVDSGETFKILTEQIQHDNFKTAALVYNIGQTIFEPDYFSNEINKIDDPKWIVFPYEKWWSPNHF